MTPNPAPRGARARQSYYWRVRNARTRALQGIHACETWHIKFLHPGGDYADFGHDPTPPDHHSPTLLTRRTYGKDDDEFRGGCLACEWEGSVVTGRMITAYNTAIEDAHDHAFPGWRMLPITPAAAEPWNFPHNRHRWEQVTTGYPQGWVEAGAPVLTRDLRRNDQHRPPILRRPHYKIQVPEPSKPPSIHPGQDQLF